MIFAACYQFNSDLRVQRTCWDRRLYRGRSSPPAFLSSYLTPWLSTNCLIGGQSSRPYISILIYNTYFTSHSTKGKHCLRIQPTDPASPDPCSLRNRFLGNVFKNKHCQDNQTRRVSAQMMRKKAEQYFSCILSTSPKDRLSIRPSLPLKETPYWQKNSIDVSETPLNQSTCQQHVTLSSQPASENDKDDDTMSESELQSLEAIARQEVLNQGQEEVKTENEDNFEAELETIKRQLNQRYSEEMSRNVCSQYQYNGDLIPGGEQVASSHRRPKKGFFSDQNQRRTQKKMIARIILGRKDFNLKIVREQFQRAKPGYKICRDRRRTLCQGLSVDFMRSLERYLLLECGRQIQPLKKTNVMYLTKALTNCKSVMQPQMQEATLSFLKFVYDLGEVKLNANLLYELYKSLAALSDQLILKKYKTAMKKRRPHQLPISSLIKLAQYRREPEEPLEEPIAELNRCWTSEHEAYLRQIYPETQSFAMIRQRFRQKFPSDYHLWTIHTIELRFQRIIREALRFLRMMAYHKDYRQKLPALSPINSKMARVISLRVPFKQVRLQLVQLLSDNRDLLKVAALINDLNRQCEAWKQQKGLNPSTNEAEEQFEEIDEDLKIQSWRSASRRKVNDA